MYAVQPAYAERLTLLSLPSLHYRRLRGDLIFLFRILNNYFTIDFTDLYIVCTQDLLPGGISLNCLRSTPDYRVDQIALLIELNAGLSSRWLSPCWLSS